MAKKRTKVQLPIPNGPVLPPAVAPRSVRAVQVLKLLVSGLVVVLGIAFVVWLGNITSRQLGQRPRYLVRFDALQFEAPTTLDRVSFLAEVRYISSLADSMDAADPNLLAELKAAFEKHPWVEQLVGVDVRPNNEIHLNLRYRKPQMVLLWHRDGSVETRAIDQQGVLLPVDAKTSNLPVLLNERRVPDAEAGQPWPEDEVQRAVQLCRTYPVRTISRTKTGWSLVESSGNTLKINTP